jgi:hypothetical protein
VSTTPDTARWESVGETSNTRYFLVEERVLAGVPPAGSVDDARSARENIDFQQGYFRKNKPGVVIIFFDNLVSQDKGARAVYQTQGDPTVLVGTALVGGNLLSRAMGSFFMGLSKPKVAVKMFPSLDEAVVWAHQRIAMTDKERGT